MKLEELTALYSPLDIEYNQAMSGPYEDLSFHSDEVKIIAGLKDNRISGFWRPVVAVGDEKLQKLHMERLYDICPNIYYMDFLINNKLSAASQFLLRHGHKARPYCTQIIDLTKSLEGLHADLRKSYKSLINKDGCQFIDINEYKQLHERIKGKRRSQETWKILACMNPTIISTTSKDAATLSLLGNCCYYFSGVGDNSHSCLWWSIMCAKEKGCKMFEMGEQVFSGDAKLVNISRFKRGFGGTCQTRLIIEKEK